MKKKLIITLSLLTLLTACNNNEDITNKSTISSSSSSSISEDTSTNITNTSSSNTSSSSNISSSSSSTSSTQRDDEWFDGRTLLECGYYAMDLPKNYENPINLKTTLSADNTSWYNNDFTSDISTHWRYIYKNACDDGPTNHKTSPNFYSDELGGVKIAKEGVGLQSPMFNHTGEKLEIRIGISSVNNNSKTPEKGKDPLHVYFFDKNGNYLNKYAFEEGSINANSKNKELKFYWTEKATEVAYFEIRLNALPYKGSQCYNFGIKSVNIKSWERI